MPDYRSPEAQLYRAHYKTAAWKALRQYHLQGEPLCRMCSAEGLVTAATVCDHITPHRGNLDLFFDPGNLQSLCAHHHNADKQDEERLGYSQRIGTDGWPIDPRHPTNGGKPKSREGLGTFAHPVWFRPVYVPLTIVCGPPGSGKTTYVEQHKALGDVVFDLDAIAITAYGKRVSLLDKDKMIDCLKIRNQGLADLMWAKAKGSCGRAWLIVSEPAAHKRQWWYDTVQPDQIVVLEAPADVCIARVRADKGHARSHDVASVIRKWWATYTRRDGELIVAA